MADGVIHAINGVGVSAVPQGVTLHFGDSRQRMAPSTARRVAAMLQAAADLAEAPIDPSDVSL